MVLISLSTYVYSQNELAPLTTDSIKHTKPNVIVIVADQMRRHSLGFWQKENHTHLLTGSSDLVITPNLDKLAAKGAVFTQAIANYPLCSPFRGMLLSGLYPHKNGVTNNTRIDRPNVGLRTDITTLPKVLAQAGYNTALVGKGHWQNNLPLFDKKGHFVGSTQAPGGHFIKGTKYDTYIPPGPGRHGIEYWYQTIGHNHDNPIVYTNDKTISGVPEGHPYYPKRYTAVDQADIIIQYLDNTHQQRDVNKPFSILWTMDPPHSPYHEMDDTDEDIYNQYYKDIAIEKLLNRANVSISRAEKYARFYFSMVTLVDREVGRVMNKLEKMGIADNTLIVFTADHGEMMGSHNKMTKNVIYEESLGIPLIFYYPNKIKHQINDLLIGVPDFMPTTLGLLGLETEIPDKLDGQNFARYLFTPGYSDRQKPKSSLYYGAGDTYGVKTNRYTYAVNNKGELAFLFDNIDDPFQLKNLSLHDIPKDDLSSLKAELGNWLAKIDHAWFISKQNAHLITYPSKK